MTKEERHLWYDFMRGLPVRVHRQKVIGRYIVDFYIAEKNLVIELDGSQHYEQDAIRADMERDAYMNSLGINVIRYSNLDVNQNFRAVCQDIWNRLELEGKPHLSQLTLTAPPQGGAIPTSVS